MNDATATKFNEYATPTGEIVKLHNHCQAAAERFQTADGEFILVVRVDNGDTESAIRMARDIAATRAARAGKRLPAGTTHVRF